MSPYPPYPVPADAAVLADLLGAAWGLGAPVTGESPCPPPGRRLFPRVEHVQLCGVYSLTTAGALGGDRVDFRRYADPRDGHPMHLLPAAWVAGRPVLRIDFQHAPGGEWHAVLGFGLEPDDPALWERVDFSPYRTLVVVARAANGADDLHSALRREVPLRLRLEDDGTNGVNGRHQSTGWCRRPPGLTNRPREYRFDLEADFDWTPAGYPRFTTAAVDRSRVIQLTLGDDPEDPASRGVIELIEVRLEG